MDYFSNKIITINYVMSDYMFKIENEFKNANISRTVRFTEKIFEQLNIVARINNISFNLLVLQCCKYALENMEDSDITCT